MVAATPEARNAPAADVAEFKGAASSDDACQRGAAGIGRTENAADACSRNAGNWYAVLFEDLQNAEMRKATCKSATQGDSDAWPLGQWRCVAGSGLSFLCHERSMSICGCSGR